MINFKSSSELKRARDRECGLETAWCPTTGGSLHQGRGAGVEGAKRGQKATNPPKRYKDGAKKRWYSVGK